MTKKVIDFYLNRQVNELNLRSAADVKVQAQAQAQAREQTQVMMGIRGPGQGSRYGHGPIPVTRSNLPWSQQGHRDDLARLSPEEMSEVANLAARMMSGASRTTQANTRFQLEQRLRDSSWLSSRPSAVILSSGFTRILLRSLSRATRVERPLRMPILCRAHRLQD